VFDQTAAMLQAIQEQYPENTILSVDPQIGLTLHNADQVIIKSPSLEDIGLSNLIVIDPTASQSKLDAYDALISVNQSTVYLHSNQAPPLEIPFNTFPESFSADKDTIAKVVVQAQTQLNTLYRYRLILTFVIFIIIIFITRTLYLLLYTIINRGFGWFLGRKYSYSLYLKLSLHTIILADLVYGIQFLLFPGVLNLFPLAFIGLNLIATLSLPKAEPRLIIRPKA
jgi:hypothetical protein